jgi:hypothetical protein
MTNEAANGDRLATLVICQAEKNRSQAAGYAAWSLWNPRQKISRSVAVAAKISRMKTLRQLITGVVTAENAGGY